MLKTTIALGVAFASAAALAQVNSSDLKWSPGPDKLPAGVEIVVLSGDPTKAGPTTLRLRTPANYRVGEHTHPATEYVTIISGDASFTISGKTTKLNAGGYVELPAGTPHSVSSETGSIVQIHTTGPHEMRYVNAADDPRGK